MHLSPTSKLGYLSFNSPFTKQPKSDALFLNSLFFHATNIFYEIKAKPLHLVLIFVHNFSQYLSTWQSPDLLLVFLSYIKKNYIYMIK